MKIKEIHYSEQARIKINRRGITQYEIDNAIECDLEDAYWDADSVNGDRFIVRARLQTNELLYVSLAPREHEGHFDVITAFVPSRGDY